MVPVARGPTRKHPVSIRRGRAAAYANARHQAGSQGKTVQAMVSDRGPLHPPAPEKAWGKRHIVKMLIRFWAKRGLRTNGLIAGTYAD